MERTEVVIEAMSSNDAQTVLDAIDAYDVQHFLRRLQEHIRMPLPHIISDEPKDQFDYLVEVLEGALKARILTNVVALPLDPAVEVQIRHTIMETR